MGRCSVWDGDSFGGRFSSEFSVLHAAVAHIRSTAVLAPARVTVIAYLGIGGAQRVYWQAVGVSSTPDCRSRQTQSDRHKACLAARAEAQSVGHMGQPTRGVNDSSEWMVKRWKRASVYGSEQFVSIPAKIAGCPICISRHQWLGE